MNKLKDFFKKIFPNRPVFLLALALGWSISLTIYLSYLQRHFFSKQYLLYALLIFIFGTIFSGWFISSILYPKFSGFSRKYQRFILIITLLLNFFLLFNTNIQPIYFLLPDTDLEIRFSIPDLEQKEEGVRLLWIETGQGYVHYTNMKITGEWERVFGNTIFAPDQNVEILWMGKVGTSAEIAFRHTDFDQPVDVFWNGAKTSVNLNDPKKPDILIKNSFKVPIIYQIPFILSFSGSVSFCIFSVLVLLGTVKIKGKVPTKKWSWLMYMVPMLLIWGISLLIFWPGIMSNDSLMQWSQGYQNSFNDWHSGFHSLLLSFLMQIWYSPAFIAILQILILALIVAWGLNTLAIHGVPSPILWIISIGFAFFPTNGLFIVTIWKDIAYAITFLWLTIFVLKISLTKGSWIQEKVNWALLGLSALLTALFRHNGLGVAIIVLSTLPLIFRDYWKKFVLSMIFTSLLYVGIKGPVFSLLDINKTSSSQSSLFYLHHIAAHLYSGTEFKEEELKYLNSFLPVEDWDYWCCYVGTISYDDDLQRNDFLASTLENRKLAINLFLRDPSVDISHMFCSGELAWKFENNQCEMKSMHGINSISPGRVDWIGPNEFGLEDNSLLPDFVDPYMMYFRNFGFMDDKLDFYLLPGFWLFLSTLSVSIGVVRSKNFSLISTLGPIFAQSLILLLISFAPAYRYHYGTCLAGMFLIGLAFIPIHEESAAPNLDP